MLFELINPSDPYTFRAPSIEIAGAAVALLNTGFGAVCRESGREEESTPVLFGWKEWLESRGIDDAWVAAHRAEIADALDSLLIGSAGRRRDVEHAMEFMSPEQRKAYRAEREERNRSSMNRIGEAAYRLAKRLRALDQVAGGAS